MKSFDNKNLTHKEFLGHEQQEIEIETFEVHQLLFEESILNV